MDTIDIYEPKHLRLWTMPSHYAGEVWPAWYVFLGRNRDSDMLTESNFDAALAKLGGESDTVRVIRESHWAVGWVEWIGIHQDDARALRLADDMEESLSDYPVLDDYDLSEREFNAALDYWDGWTGDASKPDIQHRIRTIADWNRQHEHWGRKFKPISRFAARHDLGHMSDLYPEFTMWIEEMARQ